MKKPTARAAAPKIDPPFRLPKPDPTPMRLKREELLVRIAKNDEPGEIKCLGAALDCLEIYGGPATPVENFVVEILEVYERGKLTPVEVKDMLEGSFEKNFANMAKAAALFAKMKPASAPLAE